ncbi:MAG TPA: helix-turn-helix transcriptional regulator [Thermoanaerobaculia bacterium]|jgi:transcriptional regulator with XRE-family HTH domain|nr:helix-turn-helix transcriptional regulator [Thermoanaerobaculia bacterium]
MDQNNDVNGSTDPGAAPIDLRAIGPRIVDLRNRLGLTQRALARRAGLRPARLSKIERALKQPRLDELDRLAQVLGVSLETLAYGESPPSHLPLRAEIADTVGRLVDAYRDFLFLLVRLARGGPTPEENEEKEK